MADEYIVVDYSQRIRYFNEEKFYKFINEGIVTGRLTTMYTFLKKFPLPTNETTVQEGDGRDWGKDAKGHTMGRYCPFGQNKSWKPTDLFVLRNGETFVPKKVTVTKIVEEFAPSTDATPAPKLETFRAEKKVPAFKKRRR